MNDQKAFHLHDLGMNCVKQHDFYQAVDFLQQAIAVAPQIAEFHNNLANAYKAIGKLNQAMQHYQEALRLKPFYPQVHNNIGGLLFRIGENEKAIFHFQKSLRMDPTATDPHYNLARCYIQMDRFLDAVPHYQEILKYCPNHLGTLHNLGITFSALKRFPEALPLLSQVIEHEPDNIDALFHLGIIHSGLGNTDKAKMCYDNVLAINPDHPHAHHNLATLYLHFHAPQKALIHYQAALKQTPENKTAQHMIDALTGKTLAEGAPNEYIRALFDQYAYSYDQQLKTQLHYQIPALLRNTLTPFIGIPPTPWDVLDLGCGTGLCAPLFSDLAKILTGIDLSPNMIEIARAQGGYQHLYVTDMLSFLTQKKNKNTCYQLIIAADVFVYCGELETLFAAIYERLVPQGLFCFSVETLALSEKCDFQLQETGRYAHHPNYLQRISMPLFKMEVEKTATLRHQEGKPLLGQIYVLRKL